jgi:ubiquitin-like-conjugating enzyme ATG3
VWLYGYDEYGQPLKDMSLIYRDVSEDHAKKTVTIDTHPHLGIPYANIHPCRHAQVMKKIIDIMIAQNKQPRVDQYLFLFLKFLSAVIPTIEYDFTFDQEVSLLQ